MSELTDLAERCEKADASEQYALLKHAFYLIYGIEPGHIDASHEHYQRSRVFLRLLRAGGYESAAMSLVPKGWFWDYDGQVGVVRIYRKGDMRTHIAQAATLALALCAAALRAKDQTDE